jgi:D-cysteine desulfhydrase
VTVGTESPGGPAGSEPALFRRFPALRERLARVELGAGPTPVQPLTLPGGERFWVKRDDRSAPGYGGNKVRKLEFLLGEARRIGARRLITVGAAGSHHALATALYGRHAGFEVTLVLFPQPLTPHVREVLLADQALGAELRWARRMEAIPGAALLARLSHRRDRPMMIPAGGSSPIGSLGYVSAGLELAEQVVAGDLPVPHVIHLAAGTMGTAAGLAIGLALADLPTRIHAIRIASRLVTNERNLHRLVVGTSGILAAAGIPLPTPGALLDRIELSHGAIGAGYGQPTAEGRAAAATLRDHLALDATYTAKAAGAALQRIASAREECHLFWHTLSEAEPEISGAAPRDELPRALRRYLSGDDIPLDPSV